MSQTIIWMLGIGVSTSALIVAAALKAQYLHMTLAATIAVLMALAAIGEQRRATADGSPTATVPAITLRNLGLVWTWGALNLILAYGFVLTWSHWLKAFVPSLIVGGLCLFLSATLAADNANKSEDRRLASIARAVAVSQLVVTVVALVALVFETFVWQTVHVGQDRWVATHFMLFGSLALAAISWNALTLEAPANRASAQPA